MNNKLIIEYIFIFFIIYTIINLGYNIIIYNPESRLIILPSMKSTEIKHSRVLNYQCIYFSN